MQVYNDELYHFGKLGMKWGKRTSQANTNGTNIDWKSKVSIKPKKTKSVDFYNKERNKDQDRNYLEKSKLRTQYDNGKISYDDYVKQHIELGRKQTQKSLDNAKKMALSNMSEKEQQRFKKKTDIGKKQADMLLEKIARGDKASFMDKLSLHGFK